MFPMPKMTKKQKDEALAAVRAALPELFDADMEVNARKFDEFLQGKRTVHDLPGARID